MYCLPAGREALEELSPDRWFYNKIQSKQHQKVLTRLRGSRRQCISKYGQLHLQIRDEFETDAAGSSGQSATPYLQIRAPFETDAARSSAVCDTVFANTDTELPVIAPTGPL